MDSAVRDFPNSGIRGGISLHVLAFGDGAYFSVSGYTGKPTDMDTFIVKRDVADLVAFLIDYYDFDVEIIPAREREVRVS